MMNGGSVMFKGDPKMERAQGNGENHAQSKG